MAMNFTVVKTLPNGTKEIVERGLTAEKAASFAEDCNVFARHTRKANRPTYTVEVEALKAVK